MKISAVIKKMGELYCCHPANQVKRLATPRMDSVGTDVRATFKRIEAERASKPSNVRRIAK